MYILIDTREQKPLNFEAHVIRKALPVGDYRGLWNDGVLSRIVFERKSIPDLFGTMSKGYSRFQREMAKAEEHGIKLVIVVEGSLKKVLRGYRRSKRDPLSVAQQLFTIRSRHGVGTVFCQDREEMAQYITFALLAEQRRHMETRRGKLFIKRRRI